MCHEQPRDDTSLQVQTHSRPAAHSSTNKAFLLYKPSINRQKTSLEHPHIQHEQFQNNFQRSRPNYQSRAVSIPKINLEEQLRGKKQIIQLLSAAAGRTKFSYNAYIKKRPKNKFVSSRRRTQHKVKPRVKIGMSQLRVWEEMRVLKRCQRVEAASLRLQKQKINIILKSSGGRDMRREEEFEGESLDSNLSVQFEYLTVRMRQELTESHQLAKDFINNLGPLRDTALMDCLGPHTRAVRFYQKNSLVVLELMESRLNKMIKNNRLKKNWSTEDLQILLWLLSKYMETNNIASHQLLTKQDWTIISSMIPGATASGCMFKFVSLRKFKLSEYKWQKQEEELLFSIIKEIGTSNWKTISQKLYYQSSKKKIFRTPKQCRQHWSCYLDPKIKKGPWQKQEDRKLLQTVLESNCQKKWSLIKIDFEGRTQNALKNRFNLLLQKQRKTNPSCSEEKLILELLKEEGQQDTGQRVDSGIQRRESVLVVPEERRSVTIPFHPAFFIFFSGENFPYVHDN